MVGDFYRRVLEQEEDDNARQGVCLAVLGAPGKCISLSQWPPRKSEVKYLDLQLRVGDSGGYLVHSVGNEDDGSKYIRNLEFFEYTYNPDHPVPSLGGNGIGIPSAGQRPQDEVEHRDDVCVYASDILSEDILVVGCVEANIFIECGELF